MQNRFRKLSVYNIFALRTYRKTHTRIETANKYNVSVQWVSQCMTRTDAEILSTLFDDKSADEVEHLLAEYGLEPVSVKDKQLNFRYIKGRYKGLSTDVSPYYLLEANFQPSFQTLTDESKRTYITNLLKDKGANLVTVARIGNDVGIKNTYNATVDGKKLYWKELAQLVFN